MLSKRQNAAATPKPYVVPTSKAFDGNDGKWSTFVINVGNPGQNFRVLISTSGSTTWVPLPEGCTTSDPSDCPDQRGVELFAGAQSRGYDSKQSSVSKLIGLYKMELGSTDMNSSYGAQYSDHTARFGYDSIGLGPASDKSLMLSPEIIGGMVDKDFFLGSFGLAMNPSNFGTGALPTFLSLLPNSSFEPIPSLSYTYTAGASYRNNYAGSLVLGGYDKSKFKTPQVTYNMASSDDNILNVAIQSITVDANSNSESATIGTDNFAHPFSASIDSTLPYLWLPRPVCDRFAQIFGLTYDESTDLYLVNRTSRARNLQSTISFKLGQLQTSNNYSVINFPYAAFDLNASWPIYPESTNYFPIRRAPNDVYTLGRTFLQEAHLTVDYGRKTFSLAPTNFGNGREELVPILTAKSRTTKKGLGTGALIGIIIGAVLLFLLLLGLLFCLFRRRRRRQKSTVSLHSNSGTASNVPQTGNWTWNPSPSNHGSIEWQGSSNGRHSSNATSNGRRGDMVSPMMSTTSSEAAWPLPNNYEMPASGAARHTSVSQFSSTEDSSPESTGIRDRSNESMLSSTYHTPPEEKPRILNNGPAELSTDSEIHELESPAVSHNTHSMAESPRVSYNSHSMAERYRNLLTPPPEEETGSVK
ncbi:acid protease [Tothia fuscella]|uniref:Acid protease n=1 Tax=Tothia fuscella TaxID=1048955 RepID=A0A9P4TX81_9PEZI|nr:acid protease [Tothia fuscella]